MLASGDLISEPITGGGLLGPHVKASSRSKAYKTTDDRIHRTKHVDSYKETLIKLIVIG